MMNVIITFHQNKNKERKHSIDLHLNSKTKNENDCNASLPMLFARVTSLYIWRCIMSTDSRRQICVEISISPGPFLNFT